MENGSWKAVIHLCRPEIHKTLLLDPVLTHTI
jgi:hypothetical protein